MLPDEGTRVELVRKLVVRRMQQSTMANVEYHCRKRFSHTLLKLIKRAGDH